MASDRPTIPDGFMGAQPRFSELNLQTDSHKNAEFTIKDQNNVVIKVKATDPVKVMTKLIHMKSDKEYTEHVLVQRTNKSIVDFYISFPDNGWYKFMIFALVESDPSDSLPNVYNYIINVTNMKKAAEAYCKVYSKSYADCCYLVQPLFLNSNSADLNKVHFKMVVPGAEKVSVHCVQEWFHLTKKGDEWEGTADLSPYKGKQSKVSVMANYDKEGCTYNALFDYTI